MVSYPLSVFAETIVLDPVLTERSHPSPSSTLPGFSLSTPVATVSNMSVSLAPNCDPLLYTGIHQHTWAANGGTLPGSTPLTHFRNVL